MKATKTIGRLTVGCVFACCLTSKLPAQMPPTNSYPAGTNTFEFDYGAFYSNNLASVSQWLHDSVTNADGTPADSMQDYVDLQATAFSTSAAFSYQESAHDETLNWADFNGIPTIIPNTDTGSAAYLVSHEGGVPNYLAPFDLLLLASNTKCRSIRI